MRAPGWGQGTPGGPWLWDLGRAGAGRVRHRQGEEAGSRTVSPQDRHQPLSASAASAPYPSPAAGLAPASASGGAGPERPSLAAARPQGAPARAAAGCCPAEQRGARPPGEEPEVINNSWRGAGAPSQGGPPCRKVPTPASRGSPSRPQQPHVGGRWGSLKAPGSKRSIGVGLYRVLKDTSPPPATH